MADEDSNSGFEMISSQPDKLSYETVPEETVYRFKFLTSLMSTPKKIGYKLKKGVSLPYSINSGGYMISFSKELEPVALGFDLVSSEGGNLYVFKQSIQSVDVAPSDLIGEWSEGRGAKMTDLDDSFTGEGLCKIVLDSSAGLEGSKTVIENVEITEVEEKSLTDLLDFVKKNVKRHDRIFKYVCPLCSYISERSMGVVDHILDGHPDWKLEIPDLNHLIEGAGDTSTPSVTEDDMPSTAFNNPDWLRKLKSNFKEEIIDQLSNQVREAVANDDEIVDKKQRRVVRNDIINATVAYIIKIHGGVSRPRIGIMREVVTEMQFVYPSMFKNDVGLGYGFGGVKGVNGLAQQMMDRLRKAESADDARKAVTSVDVQMGEPVKKKGKKPNVYGIDNDKYYESKGANLAGTINQANDETDFEKREVVYEQNRVELSVQFRESKKAVPQICRNFMLDPRHIENHFKYFTNTNGLTGIVEANFKQQIDLLEKFLCHKCQTVEFSDLLEGVNEMCQVQYGGSTIYKSVMLFRKAGDYFDKSGAALFRLEEDGPPGTDSPHILAICVASSWIFEVWVDKTKALGNLSIVHAISSFLHMAFVFNLQYPKDCMTVADILQRRFARYGDDSGTRTHSKKETAKAKIDRYLMTLGEIMT